MSFIIGLSQMSNWVTDALFWLRDMFIDVLTTYANYFFNILYGIFMGISLLLDLVQMLFKKMAGLGTYTIATESGESSGDIVLGLLRNQLILNVLWSLLILGVVLLIISTFVAVIKSEYEPLEQRRGNSKGKIIGKSLRALFNMFTVPIIVYFALYISGGLLASIDLATAPANATLLSGRVFAVSAYNANRARLDDGLLAAAEGYTGNEFYEELYSEDNVNGFGIFVDDTNTLGMNQTAADKIDAAFGSNMARPTEGTGETFVINFNPDGIDITDFIPGDVTNFSSFSMYNLELVWVYYNLGQFNYIVGIGAAIGLLSTLLITLLGLIKRLYALTMLFVIAPPIIALSPVTDDPFKAWKKEFIKSALSAYSVVITINIFLMLVPVLGSIEFFTVNDNAALGAPAEFFNFLAQLLIILGGSVFFKDLSKSLANMIGADDAFGEGAGKAEDFGKAAIKAGAMATGVGGAAVSAFGALNKGGMKAIKGGASGIAGGIKGGINNATGSKKGLLNTGLQGLAGGVKGGFGSAWSGMGNMAAKAKGGASKFNEDNREATIKDLGYKFKASKIARGMPKAFSFGKGYKEFHDPIKGMEDKTKQKDALALDEKRHQEMLDSNAGISPLASGESSASEIVSNHLAQQEASHSEYTEAHDKEAEGYEKEKKAIRKSIRARGGVSSDKSSARVRQKVITMREEVMKAERVERDRKFETSKKSAEKTLNVLKKYRIKDIEKLAKGRVDKSASTGAKNEFAGTHGYAKEALRAHNKPKMDRAHEQAIKEEVQKEIDKALKEKAKNDNKVD